MFLYFAQADVICYVTMWNPKIISYILSNIAAAQLPTILVPQTSLRLKAFMIKQIAGSCQSLGAFLVAVTTTQNIYHGASSCRRWSEYFMTGKN
jgi:hypothetical protein